MCEALRRQGWYSRADHNRQCHTKHHEQSKLAPFLMGICVGGKRADCSVLPLHGEDQRTTGRHAPGRFGVDNLIYCGSGYFYFQGTI